MRPTKTSKREKQTSNTQNHNKSNFNLTMKICCTLHLPTQLVKSEFHFFLKPNRQLQTSSQPSVSPYGVECSLAPLRTTKACHINQYSKQNHNMPIQIMPQNFNSSKNSPQNISSIQYPSCDFTNTNVVLCRIATATIVFPCFSLIVIVLAARFHVFLLLNKRSLWLIAIAIDELVRNAMACVAGVNIFVLISDKTTSLIILFTESSLKIFFVVGCKGQKICSLKIANNISSYTSKQLVQLDFDQLLIFVSKLKNQDLTCTVMM